jgi:hypothetical protein
VLGELLYDARGKITGRRILPSEGRGPKYEVSMEDNGKLLGIDAGELVTYSAVLRPDGTLYGEGQGILTTVEGATVAVVGNGVGTFTWPGQSASYRGGRTSRPPPRSSPG